MEVSNPSVSAAAAGIGGGSEGGGRSALSGYEAGSPEARERFGTREGSRGGDYSQVDLVAMIAADEGRPFTREEERFVREGVAGAGFDPEGKEKVKGDLAGLRYRGRVLRRGETMPTEERHDATHVVQEGQWPQGTTKEGYVASLRDVVLDPETRILYSRRGARKHLGFVRRSGDLEGLEGREWVWVEYRLETGHWMTGFQRRRSPEEIAAETNREDTRWLNAQG